jgi:hypothetical protein
MHACMYASLSLLKTCWDLKNTDVHNTINIFTSVYEFFMFFMFMCLVPMQFPLSPTSSGGGQAILTLMSK